MFAEAHEDLFLEVITKTVFMRKYTYKKWPKILSSKFGEILAKILRTPRNLPAPTPMTIVSTKVKVLNPSANFL